MKDGRAIARYYVRRGNFLLALFSTAPWVLLFGVQLPWTLATGVEPHVVTIVLQVGALQQLLQSLLFPLFEQK
jgi:hypothetical protein